MLLFLFTKEIKGNIDNMLNGVLRAAACMACRIAQSQS
jgi:hypothetical protein